MKCEPTIIDGVFVLKSDVHFDERGSFARLFCERSFQNAGIIFKPIQTSISTNPYEHILRGMHYQTEPNAEQKIVQCVNGTIFDVVVDMRPHSSTYKQWLGIELIVGQGTGLFIPQGCAHGFITLTPDAQVLYHIDTEFDINSAKGVRWNDPAFGIDWPAQPKIISDKDQNWALL